MAGLRGFEWRGVAGLSRAGKEASEHRVAGAVCVSPSLHTFYTISTTSSLLSAVATLFSMDELITELACHLDRPNLVIACKLNRAWLKSAQPILFSDLYTSICDAALSTL